MPKFVGENRLPELLTLMKNRFRSVIDGYYNSTDGKFYKENTYMTEIIGETGKVIYVSLDTENEYRWDGTAFIRINEGVTLGETSTTAYRGDRGKTAYDVSQTVGSVSSLTTTDKSTVVGAINELDAGKQDVMQITTMPTASASNAGSIIQYLGTSTSDYENGYFYKCVEDTSTMPSTYSWRAVEVQNGTVSLELTLSEYNALSDEQKDDGTVYYVTDVLPFSPNNAVMGFTPIGTVIAVMGNTAPKNYLACNGQVVNIIDYEELADYFEDEFGLKNYFGGDGTTTFGIPDLRGEFLRGTGTNSHTDQGDGANVGEHQNATVFPNVYGATSSYSVAIGRTAGVTDYDTIGAVAKQIGLSGSQSANTYATSYTIRPTNTSVLYCIAYQNIYIGSGSGGGGTSDYPDLTNKPQINGNELVGNKTSSQLGLTDVSWTQSVSTGTKIAEIDINGTTTDVYAPSGGSGTGGHEIQESGTALPTEPALNFEDFDLDDNSTDSSTDVKPHRLSSAELDEIVTRPPAAYRGNEYSESEQVVGHWIDGKPLYQITFSGTTPSPLNTDTVIHTITNADMVMITVARFYRSNNSMWYTTTCSGQHNCGIINTNEIVFWTSQQSYASQPYMITVQYTKTTD